ncbi:MAG: DTW domain-containing protein [Deltaproteobacteria bacterium]|nr:DTW domain-containing protein [Deltaproteobacteria bacterium]
MTAATDRCPECQKPRAICVCDRITPLATEHRVLVLQHPQEGDTDLGTVPLLARALPKCKVRVGLSWASLAQALEEPEAENARWAVIYPTKIAEDLPPEVLSQPVLLLDKKGRLRDEDAQGERASARRGLEGIVVLDGTWSQAKTLWWRNPWLLKLGRVVLNPREPSIYGRIRKEPRREYVSTLEAVADVLVALGEPEQVRTDLRRAMRTMVQRARDAGVRPAPSPRRRTRPD